MSGAHREAKAEVEGIRVAPLAAVVTNTRCEFFTIFLYYPCDRKVASAQEILSAARKLWNLAFAVRVGKHFVWQLLHLTRERQLFLREQMIVSRDWGGSSIVTNRFLEVVDRSTTCEPRINS